MSLSSQQTDAPTLSVVVPARDEVVAIGPLVAEIGMVLDGHVFELIVIDDGSTDGTRDALMALQVRHDFLLVIRNDAPRGQSCAIRQGVRLARGGMIVTLDGDGQNPPGEIGRLLAPFDAPGSGRLGLVQGARARRRDTAARRWASRAANRIRDALLHDGVRDSGCGMKAFRRSAYLDLPWFDHIHRFMPAMMLREGWDVAVVSVAHRDRMGGASKYSNLARALVGVPDLLGAAWLIRRRACVRGVLREAAPVVPAFESPAVVELPLT